MRGDGLPAVRTSGLADLHPQAVGTGFDGTSLRGIQRGGELVGLDVKAVKASRDRLDELPLPAIVHVGGNHWTVLHEVGPDQVRVADPAVGLRRLPREEFLEDWSGFAALADADACAGTRAGRVHEHPLAVAPRSPLSQGAGDRAGRWRSP